MLHRVLLTAASVVVLSAAANAADMYRPSAGGYKDVPYVGVNWSGLYVGVNGGYGTDASNIGSKIGAPFDLSPAGAFGGGQIGYNAQRGNFVFGVEADIQGANITDSKTLTETVTVGDAGQLRLGLNTSLDWFGTVRGRVGYAFDRTLVYATGGLAYGQITDGAYLSAYQAIRALNIALPVLRQRQLTQRAMLLAGALSTSSPRTGQPKLSISTSTWGKIAYGPRPPRRISLSPRFALA